MADNTLMDSEASVLATFDFLGENVVDEEEENLSDPENDEDDDRMEKRVKVKKVQMASLVNL